MSVLLGVQDNKRGTGLLHMLHVQGMYSSSLQHMLAAQGASHFDRYLEATLRLNVQLLLHSARLLRQLQLIGQIDGRPILAGNDVVSPCNDAVRVRRIQSPWQTTTSQGPVHREGASAARVLGVFQNKRLACALSGCKSSRPCRVELHHAALLSQLVLLRQCYRR